MYLMSNYLAREVQLCVQARKTYDTLKQTQSLFSLNTWNRATAVLKR